MPESTRGRAAPEVIEGTSTSVWVDMRGILPDPEGVAAGRSSRCGRCVEQPARWQGAPMAAPETPPVTLRPLGSGRALLEYDVARVAVDDSALARFATGVRTAVEEAFADPALQVLVWSAAKG